MPAVSVIVPTRNRAHLLPDTLQSIREAGSDLEIIVVDDASTDDTSAVCRKERDIHYVRLPENAGTACARNVGIEESRADLVAFVDDDDLRLPGSIDRQVARLGKFPEAAFVHGRALIGESRHGLPTGAVVPESCAEGDLFWSLVEANGIATPTVVAKKHLIEEVGRFDTALKTMEDYDLWVRLAERHSIVALDEPVAIYRSRSVSSGQKTSNRVVHGLAGRLLLDKMLSTKRAQAAPLAVRRRAARHHMAIIYNSLVADAAEAVLEGERAAAKQYLKEAICLNPFNVRAHASLMTLFCRLVGEKLN